MSWMIQSEKKPIFMHVDAKSNAVLPACKIDSAGTIPAAEGSVEFGGTIKHCCLPERKK
jgi:hypothetical protein